MLNSHGLKWKDIKNPTSDDYIEVAVFQRYWLLDRFYRGISTEAAIDMSFFWQDYNIRPPHDDPICTAASLISGGSGFCSKCPVKWSDSTFQYSCGFIERGMGLYQEYSFVQNFDLVFDAWIINTTL